MAANLPLAFGSLLAGGLLLEHGISTAKQAFSGGPAGGGPSPGAAGAILANADLGPTTNPVPGATGSRLDEGFDGTARTFLAPFSGTVVKADATNPGWNGGGYIAIQSAKDPNYVFYAAEGLIPTVTVGEKVTVGQPIATPAMNPYNGIIGNFEIGRANPANPGQPLAQAVSNASAMVLDFYHWIQSLGGPTATSTAGAGSP